MAQIVRQRSGVGSVIGELVLGRMPQHVRVSGKGRFAARPVRCTIRKNQAGVVGVPPRSRTRKGSRLAVAATLGARDHARDGRWHSRP
jgi:hypothetical protein